MRSWYDGKWIGLSQRRPEHRLGIRPALVGATTGPRFVSGLRRLALAAWASELVELPFEVTDDAEDLGERRHLAKEHLAANGVVVALPLGRLGFGGNQTKRPRSIGGVVYPAVGEEHTPVFGDAVEEFRVGQRLVANPLPNEAPEVVVVPRQAPPTRLVGRADGLLVQEERLLPERAARRQGSHVERRVAENARQCLGDVGPDDG